MEKLIKEIEELIGEYSSCYSPEKYKLLLNQKFNILKNEIQDRRDEQWIDELCKLDDETLEKVIKVVQFGEIPKTMPIARAIEKKKSSYLKIRESNFTEE